MKALDIFAGAGGWSVGAQRVGIDIVGAINHWPVAVASHTANHPHARHWCEDTLRVDPRDVPAHDVLLASPACQGHSPARGVDRPHHDAMRATAWCVVRFAEACEPRYLAVENVPAFTAWACYPAWRAALTALGYQLAEYILDAADFGVPQERRRVFVVGERNAKRAPRIESPRLPHAPASSFLHLDRGPWSPVAGHAPKTLARIAAAQRAHGPDVLAPYYGSGSGLTGRPLSRPIGTLTTRDRYALVRGDRMRMVAVDEMKAATSFPADYVLAGTRAEQVMQIGNAVVPVVGSGVLAQMFGGAASRAA